MDTIQHHWKISVFSSVDWRFYHNDRWRFFHPDGWMWKYVAWPVNKNRVRWTILGISLIKPLIFIDAWHLFKSTAITALILAVVLYQPAWHWPQDMPQHVHRGIDLLLYGLVYNATFLLFYKRLLIIKTKS